MNWATIVPLLIGSALTLVTTVFVEYLKFLQASRASQRERGERMLSQLQDHIVETQHSLEVMMELGTQIFQRPATEDEDTVLRAQFRAAVHKCIIYNSRLPVEEWRKVVLDLIEFTTAACEENIDTDDADSLWNKATTQYLTAVECVAAPLQDRLKLGLAKVD